jgi:hypothetical protein
MALEIRRQLFMAGQLAARYGNVKMAACAISH